jgi:hypothetical protein
VPCIVAPIEPDNITNLIRKCVIDKTVDNLTFAFIAPLKANNSIVHNNLSKIRVIDIACIPQLHQMLKTQFKEIGALEVIAPLKLYYLILCLVDFFGKKRKPFASWKCHYKTSHMHDKNVSRAYELQAPKATFYIACQFAVH